MPDGFTIDLSELDKAIADLVSLPRETVPFLRKAIQVNAGKVKASWRDKLEGNVYAPRVPYAVTYDTRETRYGIETEIGAEKHVGKQGGVALLLEYGAPRRGLAARGFGLASLQENLDDLETGISKAIDAGLRAVSWE